ncbi:hypothetical protein EV175_006695, partial [Coemansia sp. RSA 1933]
MGANYFFGGSLEVSIATAAVASFNTAAIAAYMSFAPGSTAGDHDRAQPYRLVFRAVDPDMATRAGSSTALIVLPPPQTDPTATTSHKEGSGSGYAAPLVPHRGGYGELLVFFLIVGCGIAVKARRGSESDSSRFASTASTTGTIGRAECASSDRGNSAHESSLLTNVSIPKPKAGAIEEALAAIVGEHYPTGPPKTEDKA